MRLNLRSLQIVVELSGAFSLLSRRRWGIRATATARKIKIEIGEGKYEEKIYFPGRRLIDGGCNVRVTVTVRNGIRKR